MAYVDLKTLKNSPGSKLLMVLNSTHQRVEKEYNGRTFNVYDYNVIVDNQSTTLSASDALKRKLDDYGIGDSIYLSYEEFTNNEGQLRHYWKVESSLTSNSSDNKNEFQKLLDEKKKSLDNEASRPFVNNGARFGMIFNNAFKVYMQNDCQMSMQDFVDCFTRIESFVDACENRTEKPQEQPIKPVEDFSTDDLPF